MDDMSNDFLNKKMIYVNEIEHMKSDLEGKDTQICRLSKEITSLKLRLDSQGQQGGQDPQEAEVC